MRLPHTSATRREGGFLLLEAILALALFAMIAVGFTSAIQKIGSAAVYAGERMRVQRVMETLLTEASKAVQFEPSEDGLGEDEQGVYYTRIIEEIELENMDGQPLQNMYRIAILAEWTDEIGREFMRGAELIRYEPLYQNTR